jgi:uncharacterized protein
MPNRLADETSPYLLQHKDNPVDWYPWGDEAFARAQAEDKPVFLSVGYSSCHWCHVMEHESFEDEEVARMLNESFISVKVDREERPDVDEAYMTAVQLTAGRGGWPMSAFLTPDRKPFFAGTYFPKEDRGQYPGFKSVLRQISSAWKSRRADVRKAADGIAEALRETFSTRAPGTFTPLGPKLLNEAVERQISDFDPKHGGFGQSPKFPPHTGLEFLMDYALHPAAEQELREAALGMSFVTLEKMALGGIHDHVGGGFHRYSTDAEWLLPHFEKMLYDNALLLANYSRAAGVAHAIDPSREALFWRAARGIIEWLGREMTSPEGTFYSALDADSEGEEGKFYVWTVDEARAVLGERADAFLEAFRFEVDGNFKDEATGQRTGANIPHLAQAPQMEFAEELEMLREARERRVRPGLDDKVLVGWNGLVIGALAEAGMLEAAERAARAILEAEERHGRLPHQIAGGRPSGDAFLEGYAYFIDGILKIGAYRQFLHENREALEREGMRVGDGDPAFWKGHAERLTDEMVRKFYDESSGGFFASSEEHEELFGRTKPVFDQPTPSGNGVAIRCLLRLGRDEEARRSLESMLGWMERAPQATESLYLAALALVGEDEGVDEASETGVEHAASAAPVGEVSVSLESRELPADASGTARGLVRIRVPEGVHLNTNTPPARWLTPTRVETQPLKSEVAYPAGEEDQYRGDVEIPFTVQLPSGERAAEFEVKVTFQPCTESECLLPVERTFDVVALRE